MKRDQYDATHWSGLLNRTALQDPRLQLQTASRPAQLGLEIAKAGVRQKGLLGGVVAYMGVIVLSASKAQEVAGPTIDRLARTAANHLGDSVQTETKCAVAELLKIAGRAAVAIGVVTTLLP